MRDSGVVIADANAEYCKNISVDISNKSGTKHINLKDIYTIAELDDFSKGSNGERLGIIIRRI